MIRLRGCICLLSPCIYSSNDHGFRYRLVWMSLEGESIGGRKSRRSRLWGAAISGKIKQEGAASPRPLIPTHHRTCGSAYGGSERLTKCHINASVSSLPSVRPFRFSASRTPVLWPLLTPAGSAQPSGRGYEVTSRTPQASPDKSVIFPPATTGVYRISPWRLRISLCTGNSSG